MTLTGDAGTEGDENHRGDGILNTQSAAEVRGDVADYRRHDADSQDADDEAQITAGDIYKERRKENEMKKRCLLVSLSLFFYVAPRVARRVNTHGE